MLISVDGPNEALEREKSRMPLGQDSIFMRRRFQQCTVLFVAHILGLLLAVIDFKSLQHASLINPSKFEI